MIGFSESASRTRATKRRIARSSLAALVALGIFVGLLSQAPRPTLASDAPAIAEAVRFRTDFGLNSDPAYVAEVAASYTPSDAFGVPLTPEEETLMERRAALPSELGKLREYRMAHRSTWGGMWLTYPTDRKGGTVLQVNVAVTSGVDEVWADLHGLVPEDAELVVTLVKRSQQDLDTLVDRVALDQEFFKSMATVYYGAATMFAENRVEIDVSTVTSELTSAASQRYGADAVRLAGGGPVEEDTCSRTLGTTPPAPTSNCGPPWRGALAIYPPDGKYCTSGFVARKWNSQYQEWFWALWTAGHCESATWRQGSSSGTIIGTTLARYFAGAADVQIIPISETNATNTFLDTTASCSVCYVAIVGGKEGHDTDDPGDAVCNHGAVSGTKCGVINSTNASLTYLGVNLIRMRRATYFRQGGDSGGPVTSLPGTAEGSHTHHKIINSIDYAYFSQVWEMEAASGYSVYLGP
jgi:hypothetical protein